MNVAVVGDAQGKLYSVQSQEGGAGLVSGGCPSTLRVAPSGRVICHAPGTFPMSAGAGSHTSMEPAIPPMMGTMSNSPHGGAMPLGHPAVKPKTNGQVINLDQASCFATGDHPAPVSVPKVAMES